MHSLLLIAPKENLNVDKNSMPHLSLGLLAAYTPSNYRIRILDENFDKINFDEPVDLIAITANSKTILRAYEIAIEFMIKKVTVIIGGIHASFIPKEAKQFCSSVVIGEAESVWPQVLNDFEHGKLKPFYKSELIDISELKSARRDLYPKGYFFETVQTSRGCPFSCEFCSVTAFNGLRYRYRNIDNVIKEISEIKNKNIVIVDDNILGVGAKAEQRTLNLIKRLAPLNKRWATQASINIAENDKVLKALVDSGNIALYIGFESLNESFLKNVHKSINLKTKIKGYEDCIRKLHDYGIGIWGSFMFGHDFETKESIKETADFILDNDMDAVNLNALTPLIGTKLYDNMKKEGRLLQEKWWFCDPVPHVAFKPLKMTPKDLFDSIMDTALRVNSPRRNLSRFFKSLIRTKNLFSSTVFCVGNFDIRKFHKKLINIGFIDNPKSKEEELRQRLILNR